MVGGIVILFFSVLALVVDITLVAVNGDRGKMNTVLAKIKLTIFEYNNY